MISFEVKDMTCGHCASTITKAVKAVDRQAQVQVDLEHHLVAIAPAEASIDELRDAIAEAGYTPVRTSAITTPERPATRSGCCGSCH